MLMKPDPGNPLGGDDIAHPYLRLADEGAVAFAGVTLSEQKWPAKSCPQDRPAEDGLDRAGICGLGRNLVLDGVD